MLESEEAALGASVQPPEETPLDALELLTPIEPKEEEDIPIEDILEELARPSDEASDPVADQEPSLEDNPETDPLVDNPENNASVNEETTEESLAALDLDPKEEPDFGDPQPVEKVSEIPLVEQATASTADAPVLVQDFDSLVDPDDEVPPPPTSLFLAAEEAALGAPTTGHVQVGHSSSAPSQPPKRRGIKRGKPSKHPSSLNGGKRISIGLQIGCTEKLVLILVTFTTPKLILSSSGR